ncbi:MAG TPA: PHB depolymerase family esterase [Candidatus Dormibacteraeota bacterium]|nr:PHB depolymerase family esterase [Candidatus Dormibacteraeota bacterium]
MLAAVVLTACKSPSTGQSSPGTAASCGSGVRITAGTTEHTITSSGKKRTYLLTLPATDSAPAPLVFDFPGLGERAKEEVAYSHLAERAAQRGWIGVTPQASGAVPTWTIATLPGPDDVHFIDDLLQSLQSSYCIDPHRVYVAGISNGASFAGELGCMRAADFAAVAMVAGINAYATCANQPPLPVTGFNGTADGIVPYNGGRVFGGSDQQGGGIVPKATDALAGWAERNQCSGVATTTNVAADVQRSSYSGCAKATELYSLIGGGHTWPGAQPVAQKVLGPTNTSVSATQLILDFFAQQSR